MKKRIHFLRGTFLFLALVLALVIEVRFSPAYEGYRVPPEIPGEYEGKWYGIYCPEVPRENFKGNINGEAFPNQAIINSWGYKAKPMEEIKDLLPDMYYDICTDPQKWGDIRINETAFIPEDQWPGEFQKARREATEENKGKARLDEKGHLIDYVSGFPFPDSTDAQEIGWNFVCGRNYGQEMCGFFYTAVTDKKGHTRHSVAEQNYLWWKGRLLGKEVPAITPNPNNYDYFQGMGFKSPYDLRGIVILTHRYDNPDEQDNQWMYITSLRRVRRMATSQRWDKLPGGQDITYDSATGFQGKPTNYEWKYIGRKELLCGRQAINQLQEIKGKPGGGTADQMYQRVNTVVVQYLPKIISSVSKAIMYLDPESYVCYYVEFYDKRGRPYLFYNHCWAISTSGAVCPVGFLVADVQRIHSSNNYTYFVYMNTDCDKEGVAPDFFQMERLRKRYAGR